ncbi:MAG: hypothetical protein ACR2P6_10880 [Gammaproteobacteria bacterium]
MPEIWKNLLMPLFNFMLPRLRPAIVSGLVALFLAMPAAAVTWSEEGYFRGDNVPDPELMFWKNQDSFGLTVAIDGDIAVISANKDMQSDDPNKPSGEDGAVYVYERIDGKWQRQVKLSGDTGRYFGKHVDISGNTIVVAQFDEADELRQVLDGTVYVFEKRDGQWVESARLGGDETAGGFAAAVAISGDTIVVGAQHDDDNGRDTGAVYVFVRENGGWRRQAKLYPADPDTEFTGHHFGFMVEIEGDTLAVSAPNDKEQDFHAGAVYVFSRDAKGNWFETAKLLAPDGGEYDSLGAANIVISGDTIAAATSRHDHQGEHSGAVYIYRHINCEWILEKELLPLQDDRPDFPDWVPDGAADFLSFLPTDRAAGYQFGPVDVQGDWLIVGAFTADFSLPDSGVVYLYKRSGTEWIRLATITPLDSSPLQRFGIAVGLSGATAIISERHNDFGAARFISLQEVDIATVAASSQQCAKP